MIDEYPAGKQLSYNYISRIWSYISTKWTLSVTLKNKNEI
jgi:hypothetical protein